MTFKTKEIPKIKEEKFSAEVVYLGGDLIKFQDYKIKKAFAVFITCNEEWELTDISRTVESGLSDNSGGVDIEGVVCSGRVESEINRNRFSGMIQNGEGAENVATEVNETNGNILGG